MRGLLRCCGRHFHQILAEIDAEIAHSQYAAETMKGARRLRQIQYERPFPQVYLHMDRLNFMPSNPPG